jgi:hypothetical protein
MRALLVIVLVVGCGRSGADSKSNALGSGGATRTPAAAPTPAPTTPPAPATADDFKPETERGKAVLSDVHDWKARFCACTDLDCAASVDQKPPLEVGNTAGMTDREKKHLDELMAEVEMCAKALE